MVLKLSQLVSGQSESVPVTSAKICVSAANSAGLRQAAHVRLEGLIIESVELFWHTPWFNTSVVGREPEMRCRKILAGFPALSLFV